MKIYDIGDFYIITRLQEWEVLNLLWQDYGIENPVIKEISDSEYEKREQNNDK